MKRLYIVRIECEFAALAESAFDAEAMSDEVLRSEGHHVVASRMSVTRTGIPIPPEGWEDDGLVYGADGDVTFGEAAAEEMRLIKQEERLREFHAKQGKLFPEVANG